MGSEKIMEKYRKIKQEKSNFSFFLFISIRLKFKKFVGVDIEVKLSLFIEVFDANYFFKLIFLKFSCIIWQ